MKKTPDFWHCESALSLLLYPFAMLYWFATWVRLHLVKGYQSSVPVICIGNVTLGGAGKTPTALAIGRYFNDQGLKVAYVSRGYGGSLKGPVIVDATKHKADEVGDEPLLLSQQSMAIISADRVKGVKLAEAQNADIIIMDDGFQNPSIKKDMSLLVIDSEYGVGNGFIFPAGPLREPLAHASQRSQATILINRGKKKKFPDITNKVLHSQIKITAKCHHDKKKPMVAFAGIGRPEKFFSTLRQNGYQVVKAMGYPDHHRFTSSDIAFLKQIAIGHNAQLITTEKDVVRLPHDLREEVLTLPIEVVFENDKALPTLFDHLLSRDA